MVITMLISGAAGFVSADTSDAVLIMHFDEGSGNTADDESGNGNDGVIHGATWVDGVSGKALNFDGVDDYVSTPYNLQQDQPHSAEAWVYIPSSNTGGITIVGKSLGAGVSTYYFWYLYVQDTTAIRFITWGGSGSWASFRLNSSHFDRWIHVAAVADVSTWTSSVFVNGVQGTNGFREGLLISNNPIWIGAKWIGAKNDNSNGRAFFNGLIDEVAIYNRALTEDEIKNHYAAKRAGGGYTRESAKRIIDSVEVRIDALKREGIPVDIIEEALNNSKASFDKEDYKTATMLASSAKDLADRAYAIIDDFKNANAEIEESRSIGADTSSAESKLDEARDALKKADYERAKSWAIEAAELAKISNVGFVEIKDLKALAVKYDGRTVDISGTIRDIKTEYGQGYTFAVDDGTSMISVRYMDSLGEINEGDKVSVKGIFSSSSGTIEANTVAKKKLVEVGKKGICGPTAIIILAVLPIGIYRILRRRR